MDKMSCRYTSLLSQQDGCTHRHMYVYTPTHTPNRNKLILGDRQTKFDQKWQDKTPSYWKVSCNTKIKEFPSHLFKWRTVLWFLMFFCPCPSFAVSNGALPGRGWHRVAVSNRATQIYIWPPALQFVSLFRVLINTPCSQFGKSALLHHHCFLFLHSSIPLISPCSQLKHKFSKDPATQQWHKL